MAGVMVAPSVFAAFSVDGDVYMTPGSMGGEYTATIAGKSFPTFCLESQQYFAYYNTYKYKVNDGAVTGGGGPTVPDANTGLAKDPISAGTAYLYSELRKGNLPGISAGDLQGAIWALEDETGGFITSTIGNILTAHVGTGMAAWQDNYTGHEVAVLNLFDGYPDWAKFTDEKGITHSLNQDMLTIVPEPSTVIASALLLLPFGASTVRILRRKS